MKGGAFHRSATMAAAVMAVLAATVGNFAAQRAGLDGIGTYESRGKGKTCYHAARTTRRDQRAATKRRNVQRNRRAHRG